MRADTFQSIVRYSSPGTYSRTSANSIPCPLNTDWYSPLNTVLTRPRVRSSISLTCRSSSRGTVVGVEDAFMYGSRTSQTERRSK